MTTGGWRAAGILFAVFGAGSLAGAAVMEVMHDEPEAETTSRGERGGSPEAPSRFGDSDRFVHYLQSRIQISEEQSAEIREILDRNGEESSALYESIRPELESGVAEARKQIRDVLTEEQVSRFDSLMTEERSRRRRGRGRSDDTPRTRSDDQPKTSRDTPKVDDASPRPPEAAPEGRRDRDHDHRGSDTEGAEQAPSAGERLGPIVKA